MFSQQFIQSMVDSLVVFATDYLIQFMVMAFIVGIVMRILIYYTVSREYWFSLEFQKRVHHFEEDRKEKDDISFYLVVKSLLEKTYYELFEIRALMQRRKPDAIMATSDRFFLIQHGCARMVKDTLRQIKFLRHGESRPNFLYTAKNVFEYNPCFRKAFGVFPNSLFNDILGLLPGLFIIGGIFGTFLGIMKALPELGGMDLNDIDGSNAIMDRFLLKISFSMSTSIVGIIFSVITSLVNSIWSPEKLFREAVERFENALVVLWNHSSNNNLPDDNKDFDEHRNPVEALAEQALDREAAKRYKHLHYEDSEGSG